MIQSKACAYLFSFLILTFLSTASLAQDKVVLSGTVKDNQTGESIIRAIIRVKELPNIGVFSNEYGFYSISLAKGNYTISVSQVGYEMYTNNIQIDSSIINNIQLSANNLLKEVVVESSKKNNNLTKAQMGTETLNMVAISKVPVIFGEKDILKTLQLLPGVKSAGEGNSGYYVRGGAADQNLILLDEAPVYNASHLLGFFSTFNSDAIKDATLIKGNSPAMYGGRLSSVLDVKMKEGNNKDYVVNGGLGLISSRVSIEGPIQNDKSSFILSGRRTYADMFLKATEKFKDNILYFYDLNMKANYTINAKNKIYLSGYFGKDELGLGDAFGIDWGNKTGTIRWNKIMSNKLFLNTSLIYSDYNYNVKLKNGETNFNINSNIKDVNLKQDYTFYADPKNNLRFGFNTILHTITPSTFSGTVTNSLSKQGRNGLENAIYLSNNYKPNNDLSFDVGLRVSAYTLMGGDDYNIYSNGNVQSTIKLAKSSFGKTYINPEPRFTLNYRITDQNSFKAGYARNVQHLHILSNSTASSPSDQWIGNSYNIKPEISDQYSIGYVNTFNQNRFEMSTELYYKNLQNQVDYVDGAEVNTLADVESALLYGVGRAYGFEWLLKKKEGLFTGWVSYTLSKTERKINGINQNNWYNAKQDRTHDIAVVGIYTINSKWSVSGVFVYNTGDAVTFPTGKYAFQGQTLYQYASRNANRMPDNHRLDISVTYDKKRKKKIQESWNFSLYNVYGRENAYRITFQDDPNNLSRTQIIQTSLFRWVPSITYQFKF
ncbi:MAG: TonB-dependent receptor [Sediminibacterium sp.]|jgi:outer membrane receptor protein involved in Fe transport|nr:TonB-dependent receptor [Sediminibacterium sp.]